MSLLTVLEKVLKLTADWIERQKIKIIGETQKQAEQSKAPGKPSFSTTYQPPVMHINVWSFCASFSMVHPLNNSNEHQRTPETLFPYASQHPCPHHMCPMSTSCLSEQSRV